MEKFKNKITKIDVLEGLKQLNDNSIDTIITSPPYNKKGLDKRLRKFQKGKAWNNYQINYKDYDDDMPEEDYQKWQIEILNECFRVLKPGGSMFYNHKTRRYKSKCYFPIEFVSKSKFNIFQLITWNRGSSPNINKNFLFPTTEDIFWLTKEQKSPKVFKKNIPVEFQKEVWNISAAKNNKNHPAPFNNKIPELCIKLTTEENDIVLDPFMGIGTTAIEAKKLNRNFIGFEITQEYIDIFNEDLKNLIV